MITYRCLQCNNPTAVGNYQLLCETCRITNSVNRASSGGGGGGGGGGSPTLGAYIITGILIWIMSLGNWFLLKMFWMLLTVGFFCMGGFLFMDSPL